MRKTVLLFTNIVIIAIYIGCANVNNDVGPSMGNREPVPIPVKTESWIEDSEGFLKYSTNSRELKGVTGRTLTALTGLSESPMNSYEVEVRKLSGDEFAGYGLVFCYSKDELKKTESYYYLLVNRMGRYKIGQVNEGGNLIIRDWSPITTTFYRGDSLNRVKMVYNSVTDSFELSFNGDRLEGSLPNGDVTNGYANLTGGRYGYTLVISENELFPEVPVDVRFRGGR